MTLAARVIGRLDLKAPAVVKGVRVEGLRVVGDPVALAGRLEAEGIDELVLVDVVASLYGRGPALAVIAALGAALSTPLTVAGGIRSVADVRACLRAGADKVAINTAAVARPGLLAEVARAFGSQALVAQVDVKATARGPEVYTEGGRQATGRDARAWAVEAVGRGAGEVWWASVDRDGTRQGYDLAGVRAVAAAVPVPVVAAGGAGGPGDVAAAVDAGASGAAVATWFWAGGRVAACKAAVAAAGHPVRHV